MLCHGLTLHSILFGSGLQWRTHNPPADLGLAFLLGLCPQEKALIMCCENIWLFPIHSLCDVGHYSPPFLGPSVLAGRLLIEDQTLIPLYHDPTLHPILSGSRLHTAHQPTSVFPFY